MPTIQEARVLHSAGSATSARDQEAPGNLRLQASAVEIAAAGVGSPPSQPKASIVAYSGGLMRVPGWGLLAIDLAGLDLKALQVAILSDHDASLGGVLGQG
jgi:hypothetical protein